MPRAKKQHLKKRSDGRYACRYKDKWFMGNTEDEALEAREKYKASEKAGVLIIKNRTVKSYADAWLPIAYPEVSEHTFIGLGIHLKKLVSQVGDMPLNEVKPLQIKEVYSKEYAGLSNKYILAGKQLFCQFFDSAMADGYCSSNPARAKNAVPHKGSFIGHRQITEQERYWIENLCTDHRMYPVVMAMLYAGLRPQEAKAVIIDRDVDFKAETITVNETAHLNGQKYAFTAQGKTSKANRQIPLLPPLKAALLAKNGYLVSNAHGERVTIQAWKVAWNSYVHSLEKAINGIDRRWYGRTKQQKELAKEGKLPDWIPFTVRPYDLRHSFCCMCRDNGVELKTCIQWMGHSDSQMILKVYDSVSDKRNETEAEKLKKALEGRQNGRQITPNRKRALKHKARNGKS